MAGEVVSHDDLSENHLKASFVTALFDRYQRDKDEVMERWREVQEYRNATDTTEITSFPDLSDHTVHVPVIEKIAPQLEAIILQTLVPHANWFEMDPLDASSASKEKKHRVEEYLRNRHKVSGLNLTLSKWVSDIVDMGNGFLQMGFKTEGALNNNKIGYSGVVTNRISPFDIVFDPVCPSFHDSWKIVREVITVGELFKRGEQGKLDREQVMDLLKHRQSFTNLDYSTHYKNAQYVPAGFGTLEEYHNSGYVELLWFYGSIYDSYNQQMIENRTIVVVDDSHVVLDEETDSWDGKPYITHTGWQPRQDNLWYRGPLENLLGMNYMANHRENTKATALDRMIYPDKLLAGDIEPLYDPENGSITYLAPEGGSTVTEIGVNAQFLSFDTQVDRMVSMALETIGLPPQFLGFKTAGEKTLGEVTALQEGAMRPFLHKLRNIESSLEFMLSAHLQLAYDNIGDVSKIGLRTLSGALMDTTISKADLDINGGFVAKGASRFSQKQKFMTDLIQLTATGAFELTRPHWSSVKMAEVIEDFMELGGDSVIEPWVSITEQAEASVKQTEAQRIVADEGSKESLTEAIIEAEEGAEFGQFEQQEN